MFSVKMVARPDARMVEVPLEIEAELPRDFEGAALLSSSGLPRKVRIKAQRDALKLSTAYRADQLLADLVRTVLRGSPIDVEKVQIAARNFVRSVRERRQDGATLTVESNGRGKIDVSESLPPAPTPATRQEGPRPTSATLADRLAALERRVDQIEGRVAPVGEGGDRVGNLEKRLAALEARPQAPGVGEPPRGVLKGRGTAIEAFADGMRVELRERVASQRSQAEQAAARCDKAAALAMEAERALRAPQEGISDQLRATSAQVAAREQALQRVYAEVDLYAAADLPLAERLVVRLLEGPAVPDPAGPLERQAQSMVRAARGENAELRAWLVRAAALCGWELIDPPAGEPLSPQLHVAVDSGGDRVARVAAPGVQRKDGSVLCRARVEVSPEARAAEAAAPPADAEEVELLAEEDVVEAAPGRTDDTPPPIDERTPAQGLPAAVEAAAPPQPDPIKRPATPREPERMKRLAVPPSQAAGPIDEVVPPPLMTDSQANPPPDAGRPDAAAKQPERVPGPPFVLPGREPRDAERRPARAYRPSYIAEPAPPAEELSELDRDVAAAARPVPEAVGGDDLALATEVATDVDTEADEDPEWAQLARGPKAFPTDQDPDAPADPEDDPDPNRPPD
ncbi:MAG TPA: hypothetical protein VKB92_11045 [Myxococcales bacterium]|nr:hypothetical protein [Myxococcales bacterium]